MLFRSFPKVVDKSYEQLQQENKHLDEVNYKLRKTNEQLQEELKYTIGIVEHNRIISGKNKEIHQLKDNWNKLKEYIDIKLYNVEYLQKLCGCRIDDETHIILDIIKKEMQEIEQGSDSNE